MNTELEVFMWGAILSLYGISGIWTVLMGIVIFKQQEKIEQLRQENKSNDLE